MFWSLSNLHVPSSVDRVKKTVFRYRMVAPKDSFLWPREIGCPLLKMRKEKVKNNHHQAHVVNVPELPDIQINGFNWCPERKYQAPRRNLFPKGSSSLNKRCPGWRPNSWRFSSRWSNRTGSFGLSLGVRLQNCPFCLPLTDRMGDFHKSREKQIQSEENYVSILQWVTPRSSVSRLSNLKRRQKSESEPYLLTSGESGGGRMQACMSFDFECNDLVLLSFAPTV